LLSIAEKGPAAEETGDRRGPPIKPNLDGGKREVVHHGDERGGNCHAAEKQHLQKERYWPDRPGTPIMSPS